MDRLSRTQLHAFLRNTLKEDGAFFDATSRAVVPQDLRVRARIAARASGILAGAPVAAWIFTALDPSLRCAAKRPEGSAFRKGDTLLTIEGRARSIFSAERSALSLLGHLCGIATVTRIFAGKMSGSRAKLFDTRKTLPGLRALQKYAVRTGGGHNHRLDLREAILIKTNQLRALGTVRFREASLVKRTRPGSRNRRAGEAVITRAIREARRRYPKKFLEIEVAGLREFKEALQARPDAILLDNWRLADIRKAVRSRDTLHASRFTPLLEASGGITLSNVRAIARTGVERISVGRLTRSAPTIDLALEVI